MRVRSAAMILAAAACKAVGLEPVAAQSTAVVNGEWNAVSLVQRDAGRRKSRRRSSSRKKGKIRPLDELLGFPQKADSARSAPGAPAQQAAPKPSPAQAAEKQHAAAMEAYMEAMKPRLTAAEALVKQKSADEWKEMLAVLPDGQTPTGIVQLFRLIIRRGQAESGIASLTEYLIALLAAGFDKPTVERVLDSCKAEFDPLTGELKEVVSKLRETGELPASYVALSLGLTVPELLKTPAPVTPVKPETVAPAEPGAGDDEDEESGSSRSSAASLVLPRPKKIKAKPVELRPVNKLLNRLKSWHELGIVKHVEQSGDLKLHGTKRADRLSIMTSMLNDPQAKFIVGNRVDGLRASLAIKSKQKLLNITVVNNKAGGRAQCSISGAVNARTHKATILSWCSSMWTWLALSLPNLPPLMHLQAELVHELSCDTVSSRLYAGQQVTYNSEILWGRFLDLDTYEGFPQDAIDLVVQWSRVTLVQSSPISRTFRDYIIKQFIYPQIGASDEFKANPPRCLIDDYILARAADLEDRNLVVDFPATFNLDRVYLLAIPVCLAAYPPFTQIEYTTLQGQRQRLMCHNDWNFVAPTGS